MREHLRERVCIRAVEARDRLDFITLARRCCDVTLEPNIFRVFAFQRGLLPAADVDYLSLPSDILSELYGDWEL